MRDSHPEARRFAKDVAGKQTKEYPVVMRQAGKTIERLKDYWLLGIMVLFMLGVTAMGAAVIAYLVLLPLSLVFGWDGSTLQVWLMLSAALWLPLAVGYAANTPSLRHLPKLPLNTAQL